MNIEYPDFYYGHCFVNSKNSKSTSKQIIEVLKGSKSFRSLFTVLGIKLPTLEELKGIADVIKKENIEIVTCLDKRYPKKLFSLNSPPLILYCKGNTNLLNENNLNFVGVVGTRKVSNDGVVVTKELVGGLKGMGFCVVSGLAFGVDITAHRTSLENSIPTIAVLGGGLDYKNFYPKQHFLDAEKICKDGGLVISEFSPYTPPLKQNFIARNRIVSALSDKLLVVEYPEKSGVTSTVNFSLELNRDVLVVPGSVLDENYSGSNKLIFEGAFPVRNNIDVLGYFGLDKTYKKEESREIDLDEKHRIVYKIICKKRNVSFDGLLQESKMNTSTLASLLGGLELEGLICKLSDGFYGKL